MVGPFVVATLLTLTPGQGAGLPSPATVPAVSSAMTPFSSNGCSGFREAMFFSCCFAHDLAFWAGGTCSDRARSDRDLRRCVLDISGEHMIADIGYLLVTLGAIPGQFVKDGWGRAWYPTKRSRYAPLTPDQQQLVVAERARVCQSLRFNPQTGRYLVDDTHEIREQEAREVCGGDPRRRG